MDHRGPEHHYDEVECPECGSFFQQGEVQPETVRNNCPECGYDINSATGGRPYRGQPARIRSEMTERNTPLDGASEDRGGNPLAEGILASYDPLKDIEPEEGNEDKVCPTCNVGKLEEAHGTNGSHYRCNGCNSRFRNEEVQADPSATEPAGLGETHPVQDNTWPRGDLTGRPARDEMLGSVRNAAFGDDEEAWEEIIHEFEGKLPEPSTPAGKMQKEIKELEKIPTATWLEGTEHDSSTSDFPVQHLGWDIVEVVEPSKELTEASNKYSMPLPNGITDNLHEALIELNAWVENPEENGKLRPYKQYWSVIRPKISEGSVKIGVENPIMADIINDVARTDDLSALNKESSVAKQAGPAAAILPEALVGLIGAGGAEAAGGAALGAGGAEAAGGAALGAGGAEAAGGLGLGDIAGLMGKANTAGNIAQGVGGATNAILGDQQPIEYDQPDSIQGFAHTATYGDEYEHPSSITRRIEDPVNGGIDPHQRSDESNDDWAYDMLDVNEVGQSKDHRGDDETKERKRFFASNEEDLTNSEAVKKFLDFLPLVMEFANSEESGLEDPIIESIHNNLESEFPGYLDLAVPDEENVILLALGDSENKKEAAAFGPTTMTPQTATPSLELGQEPPVTQDKCHNCGAIADPSDKICPKCSAPMTAGEEAEAGSNKSWPYGTAQNLVQPYMAKSASDSQGPHTNEQQAAVSELLIEMGREEEIPNMLENPYEYAEELAEIQKKDPLLGQDPEDQPAPEMQPPMPNQGMPPGMPPMGAPDPMNAPPPGAPQMMASVTSSMLKSAAKHGADSIAGKCPKCDSHTTKMISQDGECKCHTCGHKWKDDSFKAADGHSSDLSSTAAYHKALAEIAQGAPVDSFASPEEETIEIDDSTHTWKDSNGEPLEEGKEYEIYAHTYDIPDIGRVVEIKPDSIVYEIESDGGLRTTIEIDRKESDLNGYRFTPAEGSSEDNPSGIEENMDSKPVPVPGESTDLSTPHIQVGSKTAGKHYTPMEQRELIDEYGEARNADKLNLENTHYAEADDDYFLFGC